MKKLDHIVVGGGAMGLATTWQLAKRGQRVLMLERFEPGHKRGASHGATRNMNNAYEEDHYLDLYDNSLELYRELEAASGEQLLTLCGIVSHGATERVYSTHAALAARGAKTELISADEAASRWPGMRFESEVLVNHDAGRISAARVLEVLASEAQKHGADLRYGYRVLEIEPSDSGVVVAALSPEGALEYFEAEGVVVAAGGWSSKLLDGVVTLPNLTVTEEHPAHFQVRDDLSHLEATWPSFNHFRVSDLTAARKGNVYGMLTPGEGIKIGFHRTGAVIDPDARNFAGADLERSMLHDYVADWFPGVDPDTAVEISCTYTTSDAGQFVLDRVGRVTFGAGFAGEGFKFVPAIGRVLADAALGTEDPPAAFRLASHGV